MLDNIRVTRNRTSSDLVGSFIVPSPYATVVTCCNKISSSIDSFVDTTFVSFLLPSFLFALVDSESANLILLHNVYQVTLNYLVDLWVYNLSYLVYPSQILGLPFGYSSLLSSIFG